MVGLLLILFDPVIDLPNTLPNDVCFAHACFFTTYLQEP